MVSPEELQQKLSGPSRVANSYRQILRSSSIIGGASVLNILIGLMRTKVVAVLLGPAGVGLIGLFQNVMATASTISALGFGTAGTRQIAEAAGQQQPHAVTAARRALFWGTLTLAGLGTGTFWLLRQEIATRVFGDTGLTSSVGWLALGVGLAVAASSQSALLNGLRRINDIARVSVLSAALSTVLGITVIFWWRERGLVAFVVVVPLATFILGHFYVARLPKVSAPVTPWHTLAGQWRALIRLGAAFMLAGLAAIVGQLFVRTMVQHDIGSSALGNFEAAWLISMTYMTFVLKAMGTDYYPRLTAVINDSLAVNRLVNEQTEVALLLASPVFLMMLGFAPWVIWLLYSSHFGDAIVVLRWQIFGDILKVVSWPLGFIILAAGNGRTYAFTESLAAAVFVGLSWIGLPLFGIEATGIGFVGMYAVLLPLVYYLAWRKTGFKWEMGIVKRLLNLLVAALVVLVVALSSRWLGAVVSFAAALVFSVYGLAQLGNAADLTGRAGHLANLCQRILVKTKAWKKM